MTTLTHEAFFGDNTYIFQLTAPLIVELERQTNAALGALCTRMFSGQFGYRDVIETIRLALIGGGLSPERAKELVETYVPSRPFVEAQILAVAILEARWFGRAIQEKQEGASA